MAYEESLTQINVPAGADLSAKQYTAVKVDANGQVVAAGAGELAFILQNAPDAAGKNAVVAIAGVSKMVAGGVIAKGALIASDANGKAKAAVSASTNTSDAGVAADPLVGSHVIGVALTAAGAADEIISVALLHLGAVPTTAS